MVIAKNRHTAKQTNKICTSASEDKLNATVT